MRPMAAVLETQDIRGDGFPADQSGNRLVASIDLGGTQVRVALADPSGRIVANTKTGTPNLRGPRGFVEWVADAIQRIGGDAEVESLAVGVPGPVDHQRGVLVNPPNLQGWKNVPLVEMLETAVGAPVYLENDANLAGLGEFHHGAGRGTLAMVYLTWSTGIGGSLIVQGELVSGAHGSAGEIGHMILDPDLRQDGTVGVVEHALFVGLAIACIVAGEDGVRVLGSLHGLDTTTQGRLPYVID